MTELKLFLFGKEGSFYLSLTLTIYGLGLEVCKERCGALDWGSPMSHVNFKKNLGVKGHRCGSEKQQKQLQLTKRGFSICVSRQGSLPNSFVFISLQTGIWLDPTNSQYLMMLNFLSTLV